MIIKDPNVILKSQAKFKGQPYGKSQELGFLEVKTLDMDEA